MMLAVESSYPLELLPCTLRPTSVSALAASMTGISVDSVEAHDVNSIMTALQASSRLDAASPLISATIANGIPSMIRSMRIAADGGEVAASAEELATEMCLLGYHRPAAATLQMALEMRESELGMEHPSTLATRKLIAANESVLTGDDNVGLGLRDDASVALKSAMESTVSNTHSPSSTARSKSVLSNSSPPSIKAH
jgi:hypothetical protein